MILTWWQQQTSAFEDTRTFSPPCHRRREAAPDTFFTTNNCFRRHKDLESSMPSTKRCSDLGGNGKMKHTAMSNGCLHLQAKPMSMHIFPSSQPNHFLSFFFFSSLCFFSCSFFPLLLDDRLEPFEALLVERPRGTLGLGSCWLRSRSSTPSSTLTGKR